nr:FliM/FliN family flagellar motor C-terminal domain-containing protein [Falsirhodobacter halotolerans]
MKLGTARSDLAGADTEWPRALTRAARDVLGLEAVVSGTPSAAGPVEDLRKTVAEGALVLPLAREDGAVGAAVIGAGLAQGVVEWQLSGRITATQAARTPTRTDAMLLQPWLDHTLALAEEGLAQDDDLATLEGFRVGAGLGRLAALSGDYRQVGGSVGLGGGLRTGDVLLFLPSRMSASVRSDRDRRFSHDLRQQVLSTEAVMQAVLCRMTLPLATVMALREGATLPLAGATVQDLAIEGTRGASLARGRLGQHRGMRAVRVTPAAEEAAPGNVVTLRDAS